MKFVVYGPFRRTGILHDGKVVDLSRACAKHLRERSNEPNPGEMAEVVTPSDLARLIERGPAALEAAQRALDHLVSAAQDQLVCHRRCRPARDETGARLMVAWRGALGTEVGFSLVQKARQLVGPEVPEHPRLRHGSATARERGF